MRFGPQRASTSFGFYDVDAVVEELDTLIDDSVDNKLSSFDLSSFPDPADYEQYLIINSNLAPLVPIDINAFGDNSTIDLVDAIFSMPSLAYRGRAITNFYGNYLALEYSQVGSEFNSFDSVHSIQFIRFIR